MKLLNHLVLFFFLTYFVTNTCAQTDSNNINKKRLITVLSGVGVGYGVALVGLNEIWYKDYPKAPFRFFNDNHEWRQLDKIGHAATAYHESRLGVDLLLWTGLPRKKAIVYGSLAGFIFQTPIEVLDGFSAEYGASAGDLAANTAGSLLVMGQYLAWDELRIQLKYSFSPSPYSSLRPNTLGKSLVEQLLKDYNGQTYWLAANVSAFLPKPSTFPPWISIALGYGANQMVYGSEKENNLNGYQSYRQYYLSLDIDLQRIPTKSKVLKKLFYVFNTLHLPAPAVEFSKKGIQVHPLYF